jgi:hypothetical protein
MHQLIGRAGYSDLQNTPSVKKQTFVEPEFRSSANKVAHADQHGSGTRDSAIDPRQDSLNELGKY